uniref:Cullin domain-containing protein n=1 Tax=Panagrellus redivivus TaxID=6233 RepID=A0A7E4V5Q5_PANRE
MSEHSQLSANDHDQEIEVQMNAISQAIIDVQNKREPTTNLFTLYTYTYQMCIKDFGPYLYQRIGELILTHLREKVCPAVVALPQTEFLAGVLAQYNDHLLVSRWVSQFALYLDGRIASQNETQWHAYVSTTSELCNDLFVNAVLADGHVKEHLTFVMLETVNADRHGNAVDWLILQNICQMLIACGNGSREFYYDVFEYHFLLDAVHNFYIHTDGYLADDYLRRVEEQLHEEEERAMRFLDDTTLANLGDILYSLVQWEGGDFY